MSPCVSQEEAWESYIKLLQNLFLFFFPSVFLSIPIKNRNRWLSSREIRLRMVLLSKTSLSVSPFAIRHFHLTDPWSSFMWFIVFLFFYIYILDASGVFFSNVKNNNNRFSSNLFLSFYLFAAHLALPRWVSEMDTDLETRVIIPS